MTRVVMWMLLGTVAAAAAILSFAALRDLATLCGFSARLAWLLPVVVDAGAAAGALIWLGTSSPVQALSFARALTWVLLASSVAGNAVVHGLTAYHLPAPWWLVVVVSAVAPCVLGSVIHLAVVVSRDVPMSDTKRHDEEEPVNSKLLPVAPELAAPRDTQSPPRAHAAKPPGRTATPVDPTLVEKTRILLDERGRIGKVALAKHFDINEYQARKLLEEAKAPRNGVKVLEDVK